MSRSVKIKTMEKFKHICKTCFESFLWIALIVLIADFVTKQVVLHNMEVGQIISIIPNFCYIQYVINDGMAFGLNFNITDSNTVNAGLINRIIFICISIIGAIIICVIYFKNYKKLNRLTKVSLGLMLAGCIGNLIDRAFYSESYLSQYASNVTTYGVVDWIAFDFGSYQYPRFNIADASLVIGVIMLIVILIVQEVKESKQSKAKEEASLPKGKVVSKDEQIMNEVTQSISSEVEEEISESDRLEDDIDI